MRKCKMVLKLCVVAATLISAAMCGCGANSGLVNDGRTNPGAVSGLSREVIIGIEVTPQATLPPPGPQLPPPPGGAPLGGSSMLSAMTSAISSFALVDGGDDGAPMTMVDPTPTLFTITDNGYVSVFNRTDTNTSTAYYVLPWKLQEGGLNMVYQSKYEPSGLADTFVAAERATNAWANAVPDRTLFSVAQDTVNAVPNALDGTNVIGWANFVGFGPNTVAALYVWNDGTNIVEADLYLNVNSPWAVNAPIVPGTTNLGVGLDIQSGVMHELGHVIGLNHPTSNRDATMSGTFYRQELRKQTLAPADSNGAYTFLR